MKILVQRKTTSKSTCRLCSRKYLNYTRSPSHPGFKRPSTRYSHRDFSRAEISTKICNRGKRKFPVCISRYSRKEMWPRIWASCSCLRRTGSNRRAAAEIWSWRRWLRQPRRFPRNSLRWWSRGSGIIHPWSSFLSSNTRDKTCSKTLTAITRPRKNQRATSSISKNMILPLNPTNAPPSRVRGIYPASKNFDSWTQNQTNKHFLRALLKSKI